MQAHNKMKILMVCLGNICRSPSAQGVFSALLEDKGLADQVLLDSAGTASYHIGAMPDPRAIDYAAKRGIDISSLRARQVQHQDFYDFDYIFAMDESNLHNLQQLKPQGGTAIVKLYLEAVEGKTQEVPDPYYGGSDGFEQVLDLLQSGGEKIINQIIQKPSGKE